MLLPVCASSPPVPPLRAGTWHSIGSGNGGAGLAGADCTLCEVIQCGQLPPLCSFQSPWSLSWAVESQAEPQELGGLVTTVEGGWRFGGNAVGGWPKPGAKYRMFIDMQTAWKGLDCLATRPPLFSLLTHLAHLPSPSSFFNHLSASPSYSCLGTPWVPVMWFE